MIKQLEKLTIGEHVLLYKAAVFVSVLASCSFNSINEKQKADAIKLTHLKKYAALLLLTLYYIEVEEKFQKMFGDIIAEYSPFDEKNRNELKEEIKKLNFIINKLDIKYGKRLHTSLEKYAKHVKRANNNIFHDFVFPMQLMA
ncbi:MAG: hypothetical protein ACJ748_13115 [Flavisolibacter sp.]